MDHYYQIVKRGTEGGGGVCSRSQIVDRGDDLLLEVMDSTEAPSIF